MQWEYLYAFANGVDWNDHLWAVGADSVGSYEARSFAKFLALVGADGWELVSTTSRKGNFEQAVFKRKIHEVHVIPSLYIEEPSKSPLLCEHANENPAICECPPDCYCKSRTCAQRSVPKPPVKPAREVRCVAGGYELLDHTRKIFTGAAPAGAIFRALERCGLIQYSEE